MVLVINSFCERRVTKSRVDYRARSFYDQATSNQANNERSHNLHTVSHDRPNAASIAEVIALLGTERFCVLLNILDERLRYISGQIGEYSNTRALFDLVHQSQGSASSLGLFQVAGSLHRIEEVMRTGLVDQRHWIELDSGQAEVILKAIDKILDELQTVRSKIT